MPTLEVVAMESMAAAFARGIRSVSPTYGSGGKLVAMVEFSDYRGETPLKVDGSYNVEALDLYLDIKMSR